MARKKQTDVGGEETPPAKKSWFKELSKLEGAVTEETNPHLNVIQTPSPAVNFTFGNGWGLPRGSSLLIGGPPKGGKSTLINAMIGQLHKDDPNAVVVKFNTELREKSQMPPSELAKWGIDRERYIAIESNEPEDIFDPLICPRDPNTGKSKPGKLLQIIDDGCPVALVIYDSVNVIQGRRQRTASSITNSTIGDRAALLQDAFGAMMLPLRRRNISVIATCHVGAEMDQAAQMRGDKERMKVANGLKHLLEYWMFVESILGSKANVGLLQDKDRYGVYEDASSGKDFRGNADRTAHRIRVQMKGSTLGPVGRTAEFMYDYQRGVIDQHVEAFMLARNRGVLEKPNSVTYKFGDLKWIGEQATVEAFRDDPALVKSVLQELHRRDLLKQLPKIATDSVTYDPAEEEAITQE